jgi:beta-xylosidase
MKRKPWFDGRYLARRIPKNAIRECSAAGSCNEAVEYWVNKLGFDAPEPEAREYLQGFGAWDDEELADHAANVRRVFWVFCGYLRDDPDYPCYLGE